MYRMLIVDDLTVIVDGLMSLFGKQRDLELELYEAYSACEAIDILREVKIDIVLSDIKMPGMEGIELLREIRLYWPDCKVIFLSSFDDFNYVKGAISGGGFDYILKTEPDVNIVNAVRKAVAELNDEYEARKRLHQANLQKKQAVPVLRQQFFRMHLQDEVVHNAARLRDSFEEMEIELAADLPMLLLIGRVDSWEGKSQVSERRLLLYALQNIAEEHLRVSAQLVSFAADESNVVWLIQPKEEMPKESEVWEKLWSFVYGTLESIRKIVGDLLKIPVSFLLGHTPVRWDKISTAYDALRTLFLSEWGTGRGVILTDRFVPDPSRMSVDSTKSRLQSQKMKKMSLLGHYLETGARQDFERVFQEIVEGVKEEQRSGFLKLEMFHGLAAIFLAYLNHYPPNREIVASIVLDKLSHADPNSSWDDIVSYYSKLSELMFEHHTESDVRNELDVVSEINDFIEKHLSEDLSLTRIGRHVHLNPAYMSRIYKQSTGYGLSEYINMIRLEKAKDLLKHSVLKIYEISSMVGYDSRLSFIRFFKTNMGVTPQEFRDM
ncbi:response regulator [Cohnella ginsengisoli]|uniref:Response regulator n=1 Tax=Cohnella ginsengisoli TaxID=425004 RepID=A0A9X4QL28_9BACL|nr:response regulator [Cohnella ginsengisoli]MDG0790293.1 response regulator [Cohnella ginsengisoli]